MDSDMRRHWGHRDERYDNRYADDSDEEENKELQRGPLLTITEESSQEFSNHSRVVDTEYEEDDKEKVDDVKGDEHQQRSSNNQKKVEDDDVIVSDHEEEGPDNDFQSIPVPLHSAFGLQAEDLMLNNSMASPTGGKYRTVSVFGGVFGMLPDPVDSDNLSLSSASDGFSSDEDYSPPKRSPKRSMQSRAAATPPSISPIHQTTPPSNKAAAAAPRVVSPPSTASTPPTAIAPKQDLSPDRAKTKTYTAVDATAATTSKTNTPPKSASEAKLISDNSMARALKAFDQTESLLSRILGELESAPFYAVAPQVMEDAITTLQISKQTLESALCLEDVVLSC
ncbi:MAG: hypothetical protein SGBAC_004282 [Bacillariaceae sp.]